MVVGYSVVIWYILHVYYFFVWFFFYIEEWVHAQEPVINHVENKGCGIIQKYLNWLQT